MSTKTRGHKHYRFRAVVKGKAHVIRATSLADARIQAWHIAGVAPTSVTPLETIPKPRAGMGARKR